MRYWNDIRGQERAKTILERAISTGRVHHAFLFAGLRGVGKFTMAMAFSAIVNCERRPEETFRDACGECTSCRKIAGGNHPDIVVIAPEGKSKRIKIAQVRDLQKSATKQPHEARYRMVVIDEAHGLTTEAANALLKTLEEPASRMRLIVVTDQAHRLLDTIISRCQELRFSGLEDDDVRAILAEELEADEEIDEMPGEETLELAAAYGEGSVGRSLDIVTSGMLDERRELIESVLELPPKRPAPLLDLAEQLGRKNPQIDDQLDVLKLFFRDIMLYKATGQTDRIVNRDMGEAIAEYAGRFEVEELADAIDGLMEAQRKIDRQINGQFVMENLLPQLSSRR